MEFHNYYRVFKSFILVEFHDIDIFISLDYNNRGIPRLKEQNMIITFVGHGETTIDHALSKKIRETILSSVSSSPSVTFYCGGYGDFDLHCASICRALKKEIPNCEVVFVTPYITPSQQRKIKHLIDTGLYDASIYPPIEKTPLRFAIAKRNEWMVAEADLIIAYVSQSYGGAWNTLSFARRKQKTIINLAK